MNEYLIFEGEATVRALGMEWKKGDRLEVGPDVARHFRDRRARELGFRLAKIKEDDNKEIKTKGAKK